MNGLDFLSNENDQETEEKILGQEISDENIFDAVALDPLPSLLLHAALLLPPASRDRAQRILNLTKP